MVKKTALYFNTVKDMKPSQVIARLRVKIGMGNPLGAVVGENVYDVRQIESPKELDFDQVFLDRFPAGELMNDKLTILHGSKEIDWSKDWNFPDRSALWNFNLHYFEFLFPLVKAYRDSADERYLDKTVQIITGWINANPVGKAPAWSSYTTALRIVTWISYYGYVKDDLPEDFRRIFLESLHCQYEYLSKHMEKDILGNHYFEDLKSLVMASLFFNDENVFQKALGLFKDECHEQILPDGMHFELSPMYHKIILEGMLRVTAALKSAGRADDEIECFLQPMLDVAYSFEDGLDRVPLFNDGGNNVAKSLEALILTAKNHCNISPCFRSQLKDSGFYIFVREINGHKWKTVVDAGQPGPKYIPGHAHCDAMSFELFRDGKPVVVNCGTYAYQCNERDFFRSTAAHNTVKINGKEQSQCWGNFRLAKRSSVKVHDASETALLIELHDAGGRSACRKINFLSDRIEITDKSEANDLEAYIHCDSDVLVDGSGKREEFSQPYAEEYGLMREIKCIKYSGSDVITQSIALI